MNFSIFNTRPTKQIDFFFQKLKCRSVVHRNQFQDDPRIFFTFNWSKKLKIFWFGLKYDILFPLRLFILFFMFTRASYKKYHLIKSQSGLCWKDIVQEVFGQHFQAHGVTLGYSPVQGQELGSVMLLSPFQLSTFCDPLGDHLGRPLLNIYRDRDFTTTCPHCSCHFYWRWDRFQISPKSTGGLTELQLHLLVTKLQTNFFVWLCWSACAAKS